MKLLLALGAAAAALTVAASADSGAVPRIMVRHGPHLQVDADRDGWLTRAEAATAAERMFERMDSNGDGRLTSGDGPVFEDLDIEVDVPDFDIEIPDIDIDIPEVEELEGGDGERRIRIIRRGGDVEVIEREIALAEREAERAERQAERAEREAERAARHAERIARDIERRVERDIDRHFEREIVVISGVPAVAAVAPVPPVPPTPAAPVFMLLAANSEEADRDGDGALSREEFRAQQLRFFDAADVNGDGRIRVQPPTPPPPARAPAPPAPPEPPR